MSAARSRATTHVPINEARRGEEEPERIGGLVFEGETEGRGGGRAKEESGGGEKPDAGERRKSLREAADAKSATRPRE